MGNPDATAYWRVARPEYLTEPKIKTPLLAEIARWQNSIVEIFLSILVSHKEFFYVFFFHALDDSEQLWFPFFFRHRLA